jgi:hypothetical protein
MLAALFGAIALGFGGIAVAAARADAWLIAAAAAVLAVWMATLALQAARR